MTAIDGKRQIIASRIREARHLAGLSQGQVAKMLGLQRPSVTEIGARIKGCVKERRRTFPLRVHQRLPG